MNAASCSTQSQMIAQQRDDLANQARALIAIVQSGDIAGLRAKTLPAIASDFDGIASSVTGLKPILQNATITVDNVYALDASTDQPGAERTQFFCGSPIVVLTFNGIPPGKYALAILHATGVTKPQQISLILAGAAGNQWQLAGFYAKPMIEGDHDGLWYWVFGAQVRTDEVELGCMALLPPGRGPVESSGLFIEPKSAEAAAWRLIKLVLEIFPERPL